MKKTLKILPVVLMAIMVFSNVFAANILDVDKPFTSGNPNEDVKKVTHDIWATIVILVQILAVAAVVFAGLRYMLASPDTRADIKKQMGILALGALLVFGAITILQVVSTIGNNTLR